MKCCCIALGLALLPGLSWAQARLNLALEAEANRRQPLLLWSRQRQPDTQVRFDTITFQQGRGSLHITLPTAPGDSAFVQLYTLFSFPVDSARGHSVTVSAAVRTQGFGGQAGVYAYAHTPDEDGKNRADQVEPLPPAQAWRRIEVTLPVKATATAFGVGLRAFGSGEVWFDDVQVRIDGRLFHDAPQPGTEALLLRPDELAQPNWGFEFLPPAATRPSPARVALTLDSLHAQQGRRSLRLALTAPLRPAEPAPVVYLGTLPLEKMRGKLLTVSGYWQQDAPSVSAGKPPGFTYSFLGNDGRPGSSPEWSRGVVALPTPLPGPSWTAFALTVPVPDDGFLSYLSLGLRLHDTAPLRLDNVRFSLDGRPYVPAPPATAPAPTAAEVAWLRKALIPLPVGKTASATPAADWSKLGPVIGPARVVGLGEVTHGSGSIFQLKHQVIRYLVEQKGFTGFALETSADCTLLNHYLQTGQGEPQALLAALGVWNTRELLELLRYLRAYNQQHPAKVHLAGIDMQRPDLVLHRLQRTTPATDEFAQGRLREIATLLARLPASGGGPAFDLFRQPHQPADPALQALLRLIAELRTGLDTRAKLAHTAGSSPADLPAYLHDVRLLEQGIIFRRLPLQQGSDYRDACMAENVEWLSQHLSPNAAPAKLALWAHNAHVATSAPSQHPAGQWLKASLGKGYVAIGFAFGQGRYAAEGGSGFYAAEAEPARPGTYEAWFQAAGPSAFVLDMRPLVATSGGTWLFQQQLFRDIGIQEAPRNFSLHLLPKEFDAVIFLQHSTAAQHL